MKPLKRYGGLFKRTWIWSLFFLGLAGCGFGPVAGWAMENVPDSPEKIKPLKAGDRVPEVHLLTEEGKQVSLREVINNEPAILVFYRGRW